MNIQENYIPNPNKADDSNLVAPEMTNVEKARKATHDQYGDIEDQELEEPAPPTFSYILSHPMDYVPLLAFAGCGLMGGICAIVAAAGMTTGWFPALCLTILGFWASYEIRMLAALKKELNELTVVQEKLKNQVGKLTEQVDKYDAANEQFKNETAELKKANAEFETQIQELDQASQDLTDAKNEFESHNKDLENEKNQLTESVDAMQGNLGRLTNQTNELEAQYKQFQELQTKIQKYAEKNNVDMTTTLAKQNEMFSKLESVMTQNASTLLNQIATDMEFVVDDEGMNEEEYNKWFDRIPQRYRDMVIEKGITFEAFAKKDNDDGVIDYEEMSKLINELLGTEEEI